MKLLKSSTVAFSSLKGKPYVTTVTDYFQSFWDKNKYSNKTIPFKVDNIEYKDGKEWKKTYDENPKNQNYKKIYWYLLRADSF
jgi:hypothetical protein